MDKKALLQKLKGIEQEQLLTYWEFLSPDEKKIISHDIEALDIDTFWKQQKLIHTKPKTHSEFKPFTDYVQSGNVEDPILGQKIISDGCLGCLIVAGGQGTRLNFEGPKGLFPISAIKHKTLFQLFAEKTLAASERAGMPLKLAIMTSKANHEQTQHYFKENKYFGLNPKQIDFFPQNNLPFLDMNGNLFLETPHKIAEGPDGNGSSLDQFFYSGIWERWYANDIRFVNFVLIDNPLADPYDNELLGFHYRCGADITIKCTLKTDPDEKVGLLFGDLSKVQVIEYTEIPTDERYAKNDIGILKHHCANISLFCMNMEFVQQIATQKELPLHFALKPAKALAIQENKKITLKPNAYKYERFIFDILPFAQKVAALMAPRETCFAPLKSAEGEGNPTNVAAALCKKDKATLENITGLPAPKFAFELSQKFYYPTSEILKDWKGKIPPNSSYIEP